MKMDIEKLRKLPAMELVDMALETDDQQLFWFLIGMICSAVEKQTRRDMNELWGCAYTQPEADYRKAMRLLKEWKTKVERPSPSGSNPNL